VIYAQCLDFRQNGGHNLNAGATAAYHSHRLALQRDVIVVGRVEHGALKRMQAFDFGPLPLIENATCVDETIEEGQGVGWQLEPRTSCTSP
jgi:hypothetical protein